MKKHTKAQSDIRHCLIPYGKWTLADGSEILFNRQYVPFLRRDSCDSMAELYAWDGEEWIAWECQEYFYGDADSAECNFRKAEAELARWLSNSHLRRTLLLNSNH